MFHLRKKMQAQRLALDARTLNLSSSLAAAQLLRQPWFLKSKRIAAYVSVAGELDPFLLMMRAYDMGKEIYLPVLHPFVKNKLLFRQWTPSAYLRSNKFDIPEPVGVDAKLIPLFNLDLVVTPIVAFDKHLHRVGMGGGFYDRSFQFLNRRPRLHKPLMIGYAHEFQKIKKIKKEKWDVKMDYIVTEAKLYQ